MVLPAGLEPASLSGSTCFKDAPSANSEHESISMKKLVPKHEDEHHPDDVTRIVEAAKNCGYEIERRDAEEAWLRRSNAWCAGWLMLSIYKDEEIVAEILEYCDVISDEE